MSRAKPYEYELKKLEEDYIKYKESESKLKKAISLVNDKIKDIMKENNLTKFGSLSITTTQKEEFNEIKAIEILRDSLSKDDFIKVVKTKEYIDDDALEDLAYNSAFDMSILASCKTLGKTTTTLRIKK